LGGQTDAVGESIVYVSEPQPLAHTSEEVIDMVENPITSDVQTHVHPVSEIHQSVPPIPSDVPLAIPEPVEPQSQSITLGSTLLEHLIMSLNETKKKLDQQEQLTRQAVHRAEEAEKGVTDCQNRIAVLEVAMQQQLRGNMVQTPDSLITAPLSISLPPINNASSITVPVTPSALSITTTATDSTN
jgi:hypothetical protein